MDNIMPELITTAPIGTKQADQTSPHQLSEKPVPGVGKLNRAEQQKASFNVSILESAAVNIGVKDSPLSLVLRTAIEEINKLLEPELGENVIQKAAESGLDVSPEATAQRIVSQSTSFFSAFKAQHPGENESTVLTNFIDIISNGIEKGFNEARNILEGLEVLEGDIASNIDQTFELVQEKLAAFKTMISDRNGFTEKG